MRHILSLSLLFGCVLCAQSVQDLNGKTVPFSALKGDITVVTFISTQCPVSNSYNDRMNAIFQEYSAKGVTFIFVNANRTESPSEVQEHAKSVGFAFPVYKDMNNQLADKFGAQVTPESYVIDSAGVIRYHGSVDDSQNPARVEKHTLRMALAAVLSGAPVSIQLTKAFGCTIKRVRKAG
jgi:peroxiredoxin